MVAPDGSAAALLGGSAAAHPPAAQVSAPAPGGVNLGAARLKDTYLPPRAQPQQQGHASSQPQAGPAASAEPPPGVPTPAVTARVTTVVGSDWRVALGLGLTGGQEEDPAWLGALQEGSRVAQEARAAVMAETGFR